MPRLIFILLLFLSFETEAQNFRPNPQLAPDESGLAIQYYQDGDYEKASVLLEKLYTKQNNNAYFDLYFNALLKLKRYDVAEKIA